MDDYDWCIECDETDHWECFCCPFNPNNKDDPDYDPFDI